MKFKKYPILFRETILNLNEMEIKYIKHIAAGVVVYLIALSFIQRNIVHEQKNRLKMYEHHKKDTYYEPTNWYQ